MFSKSVGIRNFNEAEVIAILEALRIFSASFHGPLLVESDSANVVGWLLSVILVPGSSNFTSMRSRNFPPLWLSPLVMRYATSMANTLANQGVDRSSPWVGLSM